MPPNHRMIRVAILAAALWCQGALASLTGESPRPAPAGGPLAAVLAQHGGKPVIVNFWASWCEPCREEMPGLQRLAERWQGQGLTVLTVAVADRADRAGEFLWEISVELPMVEDPEQTIARAWAVRTLPTTIVLDHRHRIVARGRGAIDWDAAAIDRQLQKLLK